MDPLAVWHLNVGLMAALILTVMAALFFSIRRFLRRYKGKENPQRVERTDPSRED